MTLRARRLDLVHGLGRLALSGRHGGGPQDESVRRAKCAWTSARAAVGTQAIVVTLGLVTLGLVTLGLVTLGEVARAGLLAPGSRTLGRVGTGRGER
ncbi:MAG: hypothetical protein GEV13_35705 [Rhodospirillales bacterium]|nr:hypothetical protein [Rhodospirillales bacterium]